MSDRDESPRDPTAPSVLGMLRRLAAGGSRADSNLTPHDVLKSLHMAQLQERKSADRVEELTISSDPVREAAMKHVRRLRIRAA